MDLNYILGRHQISLAASQSATTPEARLAHRGLTRGYAAQIRDLQQTLGATAQLACVA